LPGTFGENFDAKPTERAALEKVLDQSNACIVSLRSAARPEESTKAPECVAVDGSRAAADALLDVGRSEKGGTTSEASAFLSSKTPGSPMKPMLALCKHSAAAVTIDVVLGRGDAAALRCVETLEVVRDYVEGGALIAAAAADVCVEQMEAPCARALTAIPERRADVSAVASSIPPFVDVIDADWLRIELITCGTYIEPSERAKLGPRGRSLVTESDAQFNALPKSEHSLSKKICLDGHDAMAQLSQAFHAPKGSPERARLLAEYAKRKETPLALTPPDKYEEKYEQMKATLERLTKP
jgi:hypothetical protein